MKKLLKNKKNKEKWWERFKTKEKKNEIKLTNARIKKWKIENNY